MSNSLKPSIDTSYETTQRDIWSSGLAAEIGMNSFGVWLAIKSHADHQSGVSFPGVRRLAEITGLSVGTVIKAVTVLEAANLLRTEKGKGRRSTVYVARERLDVRLGETLICRVVLDYAPAHFRRRLKDIEDAFESGQNREDAFAQCDIIPADGFVWDEATRRLRRDIPYEDFPDVDDAEADDDVRKSLEGRVKALQHQSKKRKGAVDK